MMKKAVLLIASILCGTANATPHKCEINGKVIFQDAPCNGEKQNSTESKEPEQRELFDKVFIGTLKVTKGKQNGEYTPVKFEVPAINNTKNRVQLILKYEGLNNEGLAIQPITLIGKIDSNSQTTIKSGLLGSQIRTNLLKSVVKWRFNSWKSSIN